MYTKEQAVEVLKTGSDREYCLAVLEERLDKYYLDYFIHKRDDFLDDIPEIDVRLTLDSEQETSRTTRYKVQGKYVFGLSSNLRAGVEDEVITDVGLQKAIEEWVLSEPMFVIGDPKNGEKMQRMNDLLDGVIAYIGAKIGA